jgi:hypothetical protein
MAATLFVTEAAVKQHLGHLYDSSASTPMRSVAACCSQRGGAPPRRLRWRTSMTMTSPRKGRSSTWRADETRGSNVARRGSDATEVGTTLVSTDLTVGSVLAGYRVHRLIGRGGMGVVYPCHGHSAWTAPCAEDLAPEVALDPKTRERFLHESGLAAAIDHPSIVPIFGAGEEHGRLWISMRYVDGLDPSDAPRHNGPLDAASPAASSTDRRRPRHRPLRGVIHRE